MEEQEVHGEKARDQHCSQRTSHRSIVGDRPLTGALAGGGWQAISGRRECKRLASVWLPGGAVSCRLLQPGGRDLAPRLQRRNEAEAGDSSGRAMQKVVGSTPIIRFSRMAPQPHISGCGRVPTKRQARRSGPTHASLLVG